MTGGMSPWLAMWAHPRSTIRFIVNGNPKYGVICLSTIYILQSCLFLASYWSLGLSFSFSTILLSVVVLSPLIGTIWIYFIGWVFQVTGAWLRGAASAVHLRAAVAWSKIPSMISLFMWLILMVSDSELVFIHVVSGVSSVFVNFISLVLGVWMFVLLVQSIREIQGFSKARAMVNVVIAFLLSSILDFLFFLVLRYIYITV